VRAVTMTSAVRNRDVDDATTRGVTPEQTKRSITVLTHDIYAG